MFFQPCSYFIHRCSRFFHLYRFVNEQTFSKRSTQRIDYQNPSVRIFFFQFFCCQTYTVITATQPGRKCQMQYIVSSLQKRTQNVFCFLTVDLGCGRHGSRSHPTVKIFKIQLIFFVISDSIQLVCQIHIFYLMFFIVRIRQICCIICRNYIFFHTLSSPHFYVFPESFRTCFVK